MKINHYMACTCVCYAILLLDLFIFNKLSQSVFEMQVVSFWACWGSEKKKTIPADKEIRYLSVSRVIFYC